LVFKVPHILATETVTSKTTDNKTQTKSVNTTQKPDNFTKSSPVTGQPEKTGFLGWNTINTLECGAKVSYRSFLHSEVKFGYTMKDGKQYEAVNGDDLGIDITDKTNLIANGKNIRVKDKTYDGTVIIENGKVVSTGLQTSDLSDTANEPANANKNEKVVSPGLQTSDLSDTTNEPANTNKHKEVNVINNSNENLGKINTDNKKPNIVVIDDFSHKLIKIDPYDDEPDISHGETAEIYVKANCPNANIIREGVVGEKEYTPEEIEQIKNKFSKRFSELNENEKILFGPSIHKSFEYPEYTADDNIDLEEISNKIDNRIAKGEKIDAVNCSFGEEVKIDDLAKVTGLPLTKDNIKENRPKIKQWLKDNDEGNATKLINKKIADIEKITSKGIPVYISAGNSGSEYLNVLTLADGSISVGAKYGDNGLRIKENGETISKSDVTPGRKTSYSCDNTLVTEWAQGSYPVDILDDNNEDTPLLYDITEDGKADVLPNQVTSPTPKGIIAKYFLDPKKIEGTSFSSPTECGKDVAEKYKK